MHRLIVAFVLLMAVAGAVELPDLSLDSLYVRVIVAGSFSGAHPLEETTAVYTVDSTDHFIICRGTFALTLPATAGFVGWTFDIKNDSTGVITLKGTGGETIEGETTALLLSKACYSLVSTGTEWLIH